MLLNGHAAYWLSISICDDTGNQVETVSKLCMISLSIVKTGLVNFNCKVFQINLGSLVP